MANTTTPNMGLTVPGVGTEQGPNWANEINGDLAILDQHNHSTGQGVPITPAGLDINSDLSFQGNNATDLNTVRFDNLAASLAGASPDLGCLYEAQSELYYNDGAGNVVQITKTGSVNAGAGSITGLPSGTASASFSAGTFTWQSATNTPAAMNSGPLTIGQQVTSPNQVTITTANALASSYSLVLPTIPASTSYLTLDNSGNIAASVTTTSIAQAVNPSGAILMYGGRAAPSGYLLCDGASYLISTYPNLAAALYDNVTSTYAFGTADSTHFNVPDLRGYFTRGVTSDATRDPETGTRTALNTGGNTGSNVGSYETDAFASHSHFLPGGNNPAIGGTLTIPAQTPVASNNDTSASGASVETRPKNVYVNYIIKT